jgi:hypothetical protein
MSYYELQSSGWIRVIAKKLEEYRKPQAGIGADAQKRWMLSHVQARLFALHNMGCVETLEKEKWKI